MSALRWSRQLVQDGRGPGVLQVLESSGMGSGFTVINRAPHPVHERRHLDGAVHGRDVDDRLASAAACSVDRANPEAEYVGERHRSAAGGEAAFSRDRSRTAATSPRDGPGAGSTSGANARCSPSRCSCRLVRSV